MHASERAAEVKLRLLLLSVGSLAAQNVIDALGTRRQQCLLIGMNSLAEAAGNFRCDIAYPAPPAASQTEYIERVASVIRQERPDLVIPTRDEEVVALAMLRERGIATDAALLVGGADAARTWYDKVETAAFARRHDLPFAPTALTVHQALEFAQSYGLPLIGKPRAGNGSRGVVLLRSRDEIERAFAARTDLIAQPYIDPPADIAALLAPAERGLPFFFSFPEHGQYVITVVIGPDGALSEPYGWLCTLVGGQSIKGERCDDADFLDIARAYAGAAASEGWRGPINVQLKRGADGRLVAFELNGRFGGGTAARTCMGFDEVGEAIRRFVPGVRFSAPRVQPARLVEKYLRSYPVPETGLAALASGNKWTRPGTDARPTPPRADKLRLLLLSVGSLAAQRLIDALGSRRDGCVLIGTNSIARAAGNFRCDAIHVVPAASDTNHYLPALERLIASERPHLVIPTRDDDVLALALLRERVSPLDTVLLTGTVHAARLMHDKLETARFATRHDLPFATTVNDLKGALELAHAHGLPIVGKPRCGNATRGVVLLRSENEIERAFEAHGDFLAQPFLDPPDDVATLVAPFSNGLPFFFSFPESRQYFLQVVVGPDGDISPAFSTLSTQYFGQAIRTERHDDVKLLEIARAYASAAASEGWRGPLNIQLKRTREGAPLVHELNGRFSGGTSARAFLGFDELGEVINRFLPGRAFPSLPESRARVVQNYMYTQAVPSEAADTLEKEGSVAVTGA